jgi:hypothetical protein
MQVNCASGTKADESDTWVRFFTLTGSLIGGRGDPYVGILYMQNAHSSDSFTHWASMGYAASPTAGLSSVVGSPGV